MEDPVSVWNLKPNNAGWSLSAQTEPPTLGHFQGYLSATLSAAQRIMLPDTVTDWQRDSHVGPDIGRQSDRETPVASSYDLMTR